VLLQEQAKLRMMKEKGSEKADMFWNNLWGKQKDLSSGTGREISKRFLQILLEIIYSSYLPMHSELYFSKSLLVDENLQLLILLACSYYQHHTVNQSENFLDETLKQLIKNETFLTLEIYDLMTGEETYTLLVDSN